MPSEQNIFIRAATLLETISRTLEHAPVSAAHLAGELRAQSHILRDTSYTVVVAGLCSVGKSSFTGALWGDATLLPAAVRDCTQTNTLLRTPYTHEASPQLILHYLSRAYAAELTLRGLSYHRLKLLLSEVLGPLELIEPQYENADAEGRVRLVIHHINELFQKRNDLFVLHEHLSDDLDLLKELLAFLDHPSFISEGAQHADFAARREHLMGRRGPSGRPENLGPLLALRRVELIAQARGWKNAPPRILDTPWIPAFHEARRTELIREEAKKADALVLLSLPQLYEPEAWVLETLRERPALARRTLVVFNQIDTVDTAALFAPDGFCRAFETNLTRLSKLGIPERNLFMSCARIPFLELTPNDPDTVERVDRLKKVMARIPRLLEGHPASPFKERMIRACSPGNWGLEDVRQRIEALGEKEIPQQRAKEALRTMEECTKIPEAYAAEWKAVQELLETVGP